MAKSSWTREEFFVVMNLYTKINYGQFNNKNAQVIELAKLIGKTPGAVAYKLVHLASQDPIHQKRDIKGLANPGKNAIEIYNEFKNNWEECLYESEVLLAKYKEKSIEQVYSEWGDTEYGLLKNKSGEDRKIFVKSRVNQHLFRKIILRDYNESCAVCSLACPTLLVSSHILRWADSESQRLNPENGLCLCSIHDKAYETGILGITADYKIIISTKSLKNSPKETRQALFLRHDGNSIILPEKFHPNTDFLQKHHLNKFRG